MEHLSRVGGGRYLRIAESDQITGQALQLASFIKTPTITDIEVDLGAGLDQPFYSSSGAGSRAARSSCSWARTHHKLPKAATVKGRIAGKEFKTEYQVEASAGVVTALVPRLWAGEYARQLMGSGASADENRSKVLELGLEYGLMTPYTSILALESEQAYSRQGVKRRRSPLRGVKLTAIESDDQERRLAAIFNPLQGPVSMAGCGMARKSDEAAPAAYEEEGKMGGNGTRAKSEAYAAQAPAAPAAEQGIAVDSTTASMDGELAQNQKMANMPAPPPMAAPAPGGLQGLGVTGGGTQGGGQGIGQGRGGLGAGGKMGPTKTGGGADLPAAEPKKAEARPQDVTKEKADKDKAERARQALAQAQAQAKIPIPKRPPARCSDAASRPWPSAS